LSAPSPEVNFRKSDVVPFKLAGVVTLAVLVVWLFAFQAAPWRRPSLVPPPEDRPEQLSPRDRWLIERECERLVADYARFLDLGQAERVAELFAEDGLWEAGATRLEGRETIRTAFARRQETSSTISRHVCTNFALDLLDPRHAEGTVYLTLYEYEGDQATRPASTDGQPTAVGHYEDAFVKTDAGWRFSRRRLLIAFADSSGEPSPGETSAQPPGNAQAD